MGISTSARLLASLPVVMMRRQSTAFSTVSVFSCRVSPAAMWLLLNGLGAG